jgi:hypothetical protein
MNRRAPINVFQKLMRRWDAVHPYNAGQFLRISGEPVAGDWCAAWKRALESTGLGAVSATGGKYGFVSPAVEDRCPLSISTGWFDAAVTEKLNGPFDGPGELPFRPMLVAGGGEYHIGVIYQHWLADSAAIRMLMREWFFNAVDPKSARKSPLKLPKRGYWNTLGPGRCAASFFGSVLDLTRRHTRLRKVQKIASDALADTATRYLSIETRPGLIDDLRAASKRSGVKVNDVFLAALTGTCARHVPLQRRANRTDVAVGSVVDLRPHCRRDLSDTFGLYLGFTNVVCQERELRSFDTILKAVARQTRHQKKNGVAPASLMWMSAALVVGTLSKPGELYHFYRKEMPLAGGISNVDLSKDWPADHYPGLVTDYVRVSPTGPMTPLVFTTTTLGDRFNLGMTHRTGLISPDLAAVIAGTFVRLLEEFCQSSAGAAQLSVAGQAAAHAGALP